MNTQKYRLIALCISCFFLFFGTVLGQKKAQNSHNRSAEYSAQQIARHTENARRLVHFLAFTLNTLGSPETLSEEKKTIIEESYRKFFRDEDVQIEDDLDIARSVPTNKDVQAYLKDVDFFFKEVRFSFSIDTATHFFNQAGELTIKVSLHRNLQGITIENTPINHTQERFIEINLEKPRETLKIASIYTSRLSLEESLTHWWNALSADWRRYFSAQDLPRLSGSLPLSRLATIQDTVLIDTAGQSHPLPENLFSVLEQITHTEAINLSGYPQIKNLKPLHQLTNLRKLNCANTEISDLKPIRNHTKLKIIDLSNTMVGSLEPLKYATGIEQLYCSRNIALTDLSVLQNFTEVKTLYCNNNGLLSDISPLKSLKKLEELNLSNTAVTDFSVLKNLSRLHTLNISNTRIADLNSLKDLQQLERLELKDNAQISDLSPLKTLKMLRLLFIENTNVSTLEPLEQLPKLTTIYSDGARVDKSAAKAFMQKHPKCLVVYETGALENWWATQKQAWQNIFREIGAFSGDPTREQLHKLTHIKTINVSNNPHLRTLRPISVFFNLETLDLSHTHISSLGPVQDLTNLRNLNFSHSRISSLAPLQNLKTLHTLMFNHTAVSSLVPLSNLGQLKIISANHSRIHTLSPLNHLKSLEKASFDNSPLTESAVHQFYAHNPNCLIIFNSAALKSWWQRTPSPWKTALGTQGIRLNTPPTTEQLHRLVKSEKLDLSGKQSLENLKPLQIMGRLHTLHIAGSGLTDLAGLENLQQLQVLDISKNIIRNIAPLGHLPQLRQLNIEALPISSLEPLRRLQKMRHLNCSGMPIKDLRPLENMRTLKTLSCFGTNVRNLKPLRDLPLQTLKCYNTKLSQRKVDKFKQSKPTCEIIF